MLNNKLKSFKVTKSNDVGVDVDGGVRVGVVVSVVAYVGGSVV